MTTAGTEPGEPAGIGLGSNLGGRLEHLRTALDALRTTCGPILAASAVYETEPVGCEPGTPPFLNAVVEIRFTGPPVALLERLRGIEADMGRPSRRPRNAPRPIDLDLLYLGNRAFSSSELLIPHPRLHLRRFALEPLASLRPGLVLPGQSLTVAGLLAACPDPARVTRRAEPLLP